MHLDRSLKNVCIETSYQFVLNSLAARSTHDCLMLYRASPSTQGNGVDTGWMLPPEHQDLCGGFRQSSFDSTIFFAVSEVPIYQTRKQ